MLMRFIVVGIILMFLISYSCLVMAGRTDNKEEQPEKIMENLKKLEKLREELDESPGRTL